MKIRKLTKQEVIEKHRTMWLWIADETLRRKKKVYKRDYFEEMEIPFNEIPKFSCYCCEYDKQKHKVEESFCKHCPLNWGSEIDKNDCCNKYELCDSKGLYSQWAREGDYKKCAELARDIANLEERK